MDLCILPIARSDTKRACIPGVDRFHNWPPLIGLRVIVRIVFEILREPNIPATASSIIVAPTILPRDADGSKLAAGASCNACAGGQLQRVVAVDRQGEG